MVKKNGRARVIYIIVSVFIVILFLIGSIIAFYPVSYEISGKRDLAVVFGAGITISNAPSSALLMRLDKSLELFNDGKIKKIMVSGTDAECAVMRIYLNRKKILSNNIILDREGENTSQTVQNAKRYVLSNNITNGVVFISQKYHIPRIMMLAAKNKISNASYIAADPKKIDGFGNFIFLIRESFACIKSLVFDF